MIVSDYNCLYFEDMLGKYARLIEKPIIFVRTVGWSDAYSNAEKVLESKEVYKNLLPLDVYTCISETEFSVIEIDNIDEAISEVADIFPENKDSCEKELYIYFAIFNVEGQLVVSN